MKSKALFSIVAAAFSAAAPSALLADPATPSADASQVQTHLRLDIKDDVKEVHFINTNNDPYVYTKVYVLKNADPYELLPYVINAVGGNWQTSSNKPGSGLSNGAYAGLDPNAIANNNRQYAYYQGRRVDSSNTKVEAIKYLDGTGALIVSAEDYRFTKEGNENGLSIDEIIGTLDLPNLLNSAGQQYSIYFPKYWAAADLATAIKRVGLNGNWADPEFNSQWELQEGKDRVATDSNLNALFFYTTTYNTPKIKEFLKQYDKPSPEVLINLSLYEFDNEVDSLVGVDFQSWKNGPGSDLFSVAARYSNGWDIAAQNVNQTVGSNSSRYINFNPKFSSRYVDAISAEGKAQVVTRGSVSVVENGQCFIASTVRFPIIKDGSNNSATGVTGVKYGRSDSATKASQPTALTTAGVTESGESFTGTIAGTATNVSYWVVETTWKTSTQTDGTTTTTQVFYNFQVAGLDGTAYFTNAAGTNLGNDVNVYSSDYPRTGISTALTFKNITLVTGTNDPYASQSIQKGTKRISTVASLGTDSETGAGFIAKFGYDTGTVAIAGNQTTLPINLKNISLVGFQNDGSTRTATSTVNTVVQVNNKGERFVIGGLEKQSVVRSVSKVPYLGDIPGLGFIFDNEREVHKTSKLVAVVDIIPVLPDTGVAANVLALIAKDNETINNYGTKVFDSYENDNGFDQFLLDSDKKKLEPLP